MKTVPGGHSEHSEPGVLLNSVLTSVPFGIILLNPSGIILQVNLIAKNLLSLTETPENLQGVHINDCITHLGRFAKRLPGYIKDPSPSVFLESGLFMDRFLELTAHMIREGFIIIINDVTGLKEIESSSVQAIISGQEKERRRLAREIHDGIAPLLSAAKLELDLFHEDLKELDQEIPDERLLNIRNIIDSISADLRNLSHRLMPRLLEEFGLLSAIQNMVTRLNNTTNSQIELICNLEPQERVEGEIELNLFRCCQELLNNAIKHASAGKITVQLIKHDTSVVLMVEDNGIGFSPDELDSEKEGIGLLNVETRARTLNGEFIVESVKGRGTLISIELPL